MEVSTSLNVLFQRGTVTDQLRRVHAAGFNNIDINFSDWACDWLPVPPPSAQEGTEFTGENWQEWAETIRSFGQDNNVFYNQAHPSAYEYHSPKAHHDYFDRMIERSIEVSRILNIPWLVFHAFSVDGSFDATHLKKLKEINLAWFDRWVELTGRYGIGMAIENMPNHYTVKGWSPKRRYSGDVDDLLDLVDAIDAPHVGICWDIGHAHSQHQDQVKCLHTIGKRLKALHVQDNCAGAWDQHTAPFFGTVDWDSVMGALRDIGYEGYFTFEAHDLVRTVPESCKDTALVLLRQIGEELVRRSGL